ncbi:Inner membrane protein yiaA [Escherichia coli]|uniref:Inner membrane protein yiaA n=1 Tax=Escherichia coli TaxID=562 RepID=A0A376RAY6_ECOLX|nr:Inner membrane protein yiaA [Escherichia coli]
MDNKISTYSPAFSIVSWIALVGGIVTYLLGLWNAEMQLNEKGYYFAVTGVRTVFCCVLSKDRSGQV